MPDPVINDPENPNPAPSIEHTREVPSAAPVIHTEQRSYSLSRLIRHISGEGDIDIGLEREVSQELRMRHLRVNPLSERRGFSVPLSLIFTTKQTGGASGANANGVQPVVRARYAASGWLKSASLAAYPGYRRRDS